MRILCLLLASAFSMCGESGRFTIHMILHAIGEERFDIAESDGALTLNTEFAYSDRGNTRTTTAILRTKADFTPIDYEIKDRPTSVHVQGSSVTVKEERSTRTFSS